ncbi:MAG: NADH:ubiquinone reductase (Na(+)-transporting) subunit C [Muribaculaceae bacterium]|nr:NADH:ubiquinone reductase (Na(+)-transporting) subunit C [Muribaculaceae bacterium]
MNKQSNAYAIIYIIVLVVVVGTALALTSMSLKDRQQENANVDKMKQILASASIETEGLSGEQVVSLFDEHIPAADMYIVNSEGERVDGNAFDVSIEKQSKIKDVAERELPVFQCQKADTTLYILPVYGAGLWGPIWGYVAVEADGSTVYGAYFSHQGETPGLGAEIEKPAFSREFKGKRLFKNDHFYPIEVVKAGKGVDNPDGPDYVDGVSGGTITSQGVGAMLDNCLAPYQTFLSTLKK